jgi:ketosteroid isomerase-like protein
VTDRLGDDARRRANFALYERMQVAQRDGDKDAWLACFTDDVVFEAPAYRDGPIATGRDGMARVFDSMQERFSSIHYEIKRFIPAVDPDLVLAEVRGDNAVRDSTNRYRNDYLFLVTCRDDRIARIYEYSNPRVYADAVGD